MPAHHSHIFIPLVAAMAKKGNRTWVWMTSKVTTYRFQTERNKVNLTEKLKIKRFDPVTRKHVEFTETSK